MNLINFLSVIAITLGLIGVVSHISTMLRRRDASGQAPTAWVIGVAVNVMMGAVNLAGYGAELLALGNVVGGSLCAVALACTVRFRGDGPADHPTIGHHVAEMATGEFQALAELVASERERRVAARTAS